MVENKNAPLALAERSARMRTLCSLSTQLIAAGISTLLFVVGCCAVNGPDPSSTLDKDVLNFTVSVTSYANLCKRYP